MEKLLALVVVLLVLAPALARAPRAAGSRAEATHVYWTNPHADAIGRAKIDGTGVSQRFIRTRGNGPRGIAVDPAPVLVAYVYWGQGDTMGRAKVNGTGVDQGFMQGFCCGLLGGRGRCQVPFPVRRAHVYWSHDGTVFGLGRANINGTGANYNFIPFPRASHSLLAVDRTHVYWTIRGKGTIGRAKLDGTNRDRRFTVTGDTPRGRGQRRRRPRPDATRGTIGRANLDGPGVHPWVHPHEGAPRWDRRRCRARLLGREDTRSGAPRLNGTRGERRFIRTPGHPIGVAVGPGRNLLARPDAASTIALSMQREIAASRPERHFRGWCEERLSRATRRPHTIRELRLVRHLVDLGPGSIERDTWRGCR